MWLMICKIKSNHLDRRRFCIRFFSIFNTWLKISISKLNLKFSCSTKLFDSQFAKQCCAKHSHQHIKEPRRVVNKRWKYFSRIRSIVIVFKFACYVSVSMPNLLKKCCSPFDQMISFRKWNFLKLLKFFLFPFQFFVQTIIY